ncbi:hypothetical protein N1F78_13330 [Seonamhaeicola sp. MEBiC1930]|uniref:hypothetical protein n=1 Tax=Seonamhaeicola sp. MEBiC01930 TaxID=2976768 RepID=UPI00324BB3AA
MRNKTSIVSLYLLCFIIALSFNGYGQENGIIELKNSVDSKASKSTLGQKYASSTSSGQTQSYVEEFNDLALNLHPTIYVKNGLEKTSYGTGEIIRLTLEDTNSISALNSLLNKYPNINLLTIELDSTNDFNQTLNITSLSNCPNLKFVYIRGSFNCNESALNQFINVDTSIKVFYLCKESQ